MVDAKTHYIGDLAKRFKISQRSLRYYEELGLLNPVRSSGGFRVYAQHEVERLKTILLLKELGMTLDEISSLIHIWHEGSPSEASPKLRSMLIGRLAQFKDMIQKYEEGIKQLKSVVALLKTCSKCGKVVGESACSNCLSKREEEVPSLMKALI